MKKSIAIIYEKDYPCAITCLCGYMHTLVKNGRGKYMAECPHCGRERLIVKHKNHLQIDYKTDEK